MSGNFCLQAWNGNTSHTIDRIERGTVHAAACCMSMFGGIQPGRLRSYLVDALRDGPGNDGLIQRFQLMVWPDIGVGWQYVDRVPADLDQERVEAMFRRLVELDADRPLRFTFSDAAQELFVSWLTNLEVKLRGDHDHPALTSHLSKYRKLMPALALLFELADRSSGGSVGFVGADSVSEPEMRVSLEHAQQAADWCVYLESHARRIYSCITTPQMRAAKELSMRIKSGKLGSAGGFTLRDVYLKGWSGLDTPELAKVAVEVLEDACWVRKEVAEPGPSGGRPSQRYLVNPGIRGGALTLQQAEGAQA